MPPRILFNKLSNKILGLLEYLVSLYTTRYLVTYSTSSSIEINYLKEFYGVLIDSKNTEYTEKLYAVCDRYCDHEFDILGSGWLNIHHDYFGFEGVLYSKLKDVSWKNKKNLQIQKKVSKIISDNYKLIPWNCDVKSGFCWLKNKPSFSIKYGQNFGVDIKVPWELSRLQHLPQLAAAYRVALKSSDGMRADKYVNEIKNQLVDFIANNPPKYGVNWVCTMDVAIRAVNIITTLQILHESEFVFPNEVHSLFLNSLLDHGIFITENLEWNEELRGNHYLANIVGLLFISTFLAGDEKFLVWARFSAEEIDRELSLQFLNDGTNFEGSTAYHCLSYEMVLYATFIFFNNRQKIESVRSLNYSIVRRKLRLLKNEKYKKTSPIKIFEGAEEIIDRGEFFIKKIRRPDGKILQVGDNDSGRLLKVLPEISIHPAAELKSKYKNLNNNFYLLNKSQYYLIDQPEYADIGDFKAHHFDEGYIDKLDLSISKHIEKASYCKGNIGDEKKYRFYTAFSFLDIKKFSFPNFGLYVWRGSKIFMAIRCGPIGQNGYGGHSHNDQLSMELWIDDMPIFLDPGSYVYTPNPEMRNRYRSAKAHFCPQINSEPSELGDNLFAIKGGCVQAKVIALSDDYFFGTHSGYGFNIFRKVRILENLVEINDWHNGPEEIKLVKNDLLNYSNGYGWMENSQ